MADFIWIHHTVSTEYQEYESLELGGAYQYSPEPRGPDQRIFRLKFKTMKYFTLPDGVTIDYSPTRFPAINMGLLDKFYQSHRKWKMFTYDHPVYGQLVTRFNKALKIPEGIEGGEGALLSFDVELIEQP